MIKFKTINGFTVARMKEVIRREYKGQAVDKWGRCQYLTENGNKCAVGCFIPNGHKSVQMEGVVVSDLLRLYPDLHKVMPLGDYGLRYFQEFHDVIPRTMQEMLDWIDENVENGDNLCN